MASTDPGPAPQPGDTVTAATISGLGTGYPIIRASNLLGGLQTVDTVVERDAIPTVNRNEGMMVFVTTTLQTFQLQGGITNVDWVEILVGSGAAGITRTYVPGVLVGDAVYETALGTADRANANAIGTAEVLGIVTAVDVPAVGLCQIVNSGDVSGFVGLTDGEVYILSTSAGLLVALSDTGNINYPDTTPASGEVIYRVGVAGNGGTNLAVNPQFVLVA